MSNNYISHFSYFLYCSKLQYEIIFSINLCAYQISFTFMLIKQKQFTKKYKVFENTIISSKHNCR